TTDGRCNRNVFKVESPRYPLGWGRISLVRPRYLALRFAAYFGAIGYYAWQAARRAGSIWFERPISQPVYQTTMVGGVLVLLGLFITASISPHVRGAVPTNSAAGNTTGRLIRRIRGDTARMSGTGRTAGRADSAWTAADEFLEELPDTSRSGY